MSDLFGNDTKEEDAVAYAMDNVDHPAHYNKFGFEVYDIVSLFDFTQGNVLKYLLRAPYKGKPLEDIKKANWYLLRCKNGFGPLQPRNTSFVLEKLTQAYEQLIHNKNPNSVEALCAEPIKRIINMLNLIPRKGQKENS